MMFTDRIISEIKKMNKWLVDGNYNELQFYSNQKVDSDYIKEVISDYPFKLINYPNDDVIEPYILEYDEPHAWGVTCALWTKEEGKSDLVIDFDIELDESKNVIVNLNTVEVP